MCLSAPGPETATLAAQKLFTDDVKPILEKNCLACHAVDAKLVGPSYKEVAAKYKGDKTA